jgi:putative sigma-54 modulation protein
MGRSAGPHDRPPPTPHGLPLLGPAVGIIQRVKVVINDRTEAVPVGVHTYAERKLDRLGRHFDRVILAEVEFCQDARRNSNPPCTVQITVHLDGRRHPLATARETAIRPREALDLALDKVDRQVLKLKEKIKDHKGAPATGEIFVEQEAPAPAPGLERVTLRVRPMTLDQAEAALAASELPFHLFRDEDSGEIQVCYRRPDGGLTVVEPL